MKHFLLILVAVVCGYGFWQFADRRARAVATRVITKHTLRLGALILVLILLLLAATQLPSTNII